MGLHSLLLLLYYIYYFEQHRYKQLRDHTLSHRASHLHEHATLAQHGLLVEEWCSPHPSRPSRPSPPLQEQVLSNGHPPWPEAQHPLSFPFLSLSTTLNHRFTRQDHHWKSFTDEQKVEITPLPPPPPPLFSSTCVL